MANSSNRKGETYGVYISDAGICEAMDIAAKDNGGPSAYGKAAIVEKLRNDGYLPASRREAQLLEKLRELIAAGVDIDGLIQRALREEVSACQS